MIDWSGVFRLMGVSEESDLPDWDIDTCWEDVNKSDFLGWGDTIVDDSGSRTYVSVLDPIIGLLNSASFRRILESWSDPVITRWFVYEMLNLIYRKGSQLEVTIFCERGSDRAWDSWKGKDDSINLQCLTMYIL